MDLEQFEAQALSLLGQTNDTDELVEPLTIRIEQIGVAARSAWVENPDTHPILDFINEALQNGDSSLKRLLRLYVLPNLHLIGVAHESQQTVTNRLPEPLRSEWASSQQDLDAIQKKAE